jgi:hypothetical protein
VNLSRGSPGLADLVQRSRRLQPPARLAGELGLVFMLTWSAAIYSSALHPRTFSSPVSGIEVTCPPDSCRAASQRDLCCLSLDQSILGTGKKFESEQCCHVQHSVSLVSVLLVCATE